jgi:hypothetical protein
MSRQFLTLCGVGLLLVPASGQAASGITCDKPVVTGASFAMDCAYPHHGTNLTLVMRGAVDDTTAKPAEIAVLEAGKPRQTLTVESDGVFLDSLQKEALESIDINFDGYDDLKVWTATSAGPNSGYAYWLYDPAKDAFARRQDLDDLLSGFDVSVDPKAKTLSTSGRASCCEWDVDIYRWANDQLVKISGEASGALDLGEALSDVASIQTFRETSPSFCATHTALFDAAGRITKEIIVTEGDPCDPEQDYRKSTQRIDKTLNGTKPHGNMTDVYQDGILIRRTIVYDPPKSP